MGLAYVKSADVTIHRAGLYDFFDDFYRHCIHSQNYQERILQVISSTRVVLFNTFTIVSRLPVYTSPVSMLRQAVCLCLSSCNLALTSIQSLTVLLTALVR